MKQETLRLIHATAMVCADNIKEYGPNRKYEWELWGYLGALCDLGYIEYGKRLKIESHYRKYFNALKATLKASRN